MYIYIYERVFRMFLNYLNKFQNKGWSKNSIYLQLQKENPHLTEDELLKKSELIYKELNRLNQQTRRLDRDFYKNNVLTPEIGEQLPFRNRKKENKAAKGPGNLIE